MSADVVFFHGAGTGAYAEDAELAGSLARHLGNDFSIDFPRSPENDPEDWPWLQAIAEAIARASAPVVLVGHSVGGYLLLKFLAMQHVTTSIAAICIIAPPFPGGDPAWTFDGFDLPDDVGRLLPADARVLLYASEDDKTVPFAHRDLYAARIPRAITRTTSGGHQLGNDLQVVADDIRALW
ncbi:alpha/beta fold hydrolase [Kocuria himachalensis]